MNTPTIVVGRALAVLLLALALTGCGKDAPTPAATAAADAPKADPLSIALTPELKAIVASESPREIEVRETLRLPARIEVDGTRMARIGSPVTGRITDIAAEIGMSVKRGTVLAQISSTELSQAQLEFLKANSQRLLAERGAQRAQQLFDADVIGQAELQRRESELVQATAEVSAARDALKVLGMSEEKLARLTASRTVTSITSLVSTLNGTVIDRRVTTGQVVQPADTAFLIADLSNVWVVAEVPEQGAGTVRRGEYVQVEIPAFPNRKIAGRINFVGATVNPETRTVQVRMDLANPESEYKPAMLASVLIKGAPRKRLTVPVTAVVRDENRDYVFVQAAADRMTLRQVTLGIEYEGARVVESGLRADETIVGDGAFHLNNERKRRLQEGR